MTATDIAPLTVSPLSAALGVEVAGIDLDSATAEQVDTIRRLLLEHLVLFFPNQ